MKKFIKNHKGVTMMEVLVTVALLAIVIVPCLSSFVMAQKGNALAAQTQNEYTQAQNLMEELKAIPSNNDVETWKGKIIEKINATTTDAGGNPINDGISVFYDYDNSHNYYEVRIYAGEFEEEPTGEGADQPIIKGVIAP